MGSGFSLQCQTTFLASLDVRADFGGGLIGGCGKGIVKRGWKC